MGLFGSKSKTVKTESKNESFLHPMLQGHIKNAIDETMGGQGIPDYMLAGLTPDQQAALKGMSQSDALNQFAKWSGQQGGYLTGVGKDSLTQGMDYYSQLGALGNAIANQDLSISADQIKDTASQLYDQDRVNRQTDLVADRLNRDLRENTLQSIYRDGAASGNVGSSRSAIAQGVAMRGTNEAIGNAAVQLSDAESLRALQSAQSQLNQNAANKLAGQSQALGAYGTAAGGMSNIGSNSLNQALQSMQQSAGAGQQALINQLNAGNILQGQNQAQMDTNWMNQMKNQNEALSKLQLVGGTVLPMAGLQTTQTNTNTMKGGGGLMGGLGGLVGAGIGGYFGGTAGASLGMGLGSTAGNMLG